MKKYDSRYDYEITAFEAFGFKTRKYSEWRSLRNRRLLVSLILFVIGALLVPFSYLWPISFLFIGAGFLALFHATSAIAAIFFEFSPENLKEFHERRKKRR